MITSLVGFEELGNNDAFTTAALELRLSVCGMFLSGVCVSSKSELNQGPLSGVIHKPSGNSTDPLYTVSSRGRNNQDDDNADEFDL